MYSLRVAQPQGRHYYRFACCTCVHTLGNYTHSMTLYRESIKLSRLWDIITPVLTWLVKYAVGVSGSPITLLLDSPCEHVLFSDCRWSPVITSITRHSHQGTRHSNKGTRHSTHTKSLTARTKALPFLALRHFHIALHLGILV